MNFEVIQGHSFSSVGVHKLPACMGTLIIPGLWTHPIDFKRILHVWGFFFSQQRREVEQGVVWT